MSRLSYIGSLGRVYVYDTFDRSGNRIPIGIIEKQIGKRSGKALFAVRMNHKVHSRHVSFDHAKQMIERLYPSNEIAWLRKS